MFGGLWWLVIVLCTLCTSTTCTGEQQSDQHKVAVTHSDGMILSAEFINGLHFTSLLHLLNWKFWNIEYSRYSVLSLGY